MTFADPSASPQANVARALAELRRGGAIAISAGNDSTIAIAAELIEEPGFAWILGAAQGSGPRLLMTVERAVRLGLGSPAGIERFRLLSLPETVSADVIRQLADPTAEAIDPSFLELQTSDDVPAVLCQAVIELAKAARLLPAAVVIAVPRAKVEAIVAEPYRLAAGDVIAYRRSAASGLKRVGSSRVPLAGAVETEI